MIVAAPIVRLIQKIGVGVNTIDMEGGEGARYFQSGNPPGTKLAAPVRGA